MMFPEDPNKRPELWQHFADKVVAGSIILLVHKGKLTAEASSGGPREEGVERVLDSFRSCRIVRFGFSRGQAIGPFFAFDVCGHRARLAEYAIDKGIQSDSPRAVQEALHSVAINLPVRR